MISGIGIAMMILRIKGNPDLNLQNLLMPILLEQPA